MAQLTFEWQNKKGENTRQSVSRCLGDSHYHNIMLCWKAALESCGWDQRTTLRTIDSRGYSITNWWEILSFQVRAAPKNFLKTHKNYII